jgi:hypothetical protein
VPLSDVGVLFSPPVAATSPPGFGPFSSILVKGGPSLLSHRPRQGGRREGLTPEQVEIVIGSVTFSRSIPPERRLGEIDAYS